MLTTLEMRRAEFGFYAAHLAVYDGEVEPLHGHTFHVTLRLSGERDANGMLVEFSEIRAAMRKARLVAAELEVAEPPGTSAMARVDLTR
ncbi:MAG TPA: 6-carboxytetrahydropterin synthase [Pseudonocardiaceae bacterium]|jgi:6-pyruvoyltetrahydropterin/6-carboxytetrahydropterin synthase|nr:6-carboxytetrahydropterin synthase [Pseudonocardiaceae bacterium]